MVICLSIALITGGAMIGSAVADGGATPLSTGTQADILAAEQANVTFRDQITSATEQRVLVANASLPAGGFVVLVDESGNRVGSTPFLEPGVHTDLVLPLESPVCDGAALTAVLYRDDGNRSLGPGDEPYRSHGEPIQTTATVTPTAIATYSFADQQIVNGRVTVGTAAVPEEGGFVIVANASGSAVSEPLSPEELDPLGQSEYLGANTSGNVRVLLEARPPESTTLVAFTVADSNDNRSLDSGDAPALPLCKQIGYDTATVSIGSTTPTGTASPSPSPTMSSVVTSTLVEDTDNSTSTARVNQPGFEVLATVVALIILAAIVGLKQRAT
jgi:hypothetical protein